MKKVTKYEASDGTVFDTETEAINHEKLIELEEWYETNGLLGIRGEDTDWGEFLEWCCTHKKKVKEVLELFGA